MALTSAERQKVRDYLGLPTIFTDPRIVYQSPNLDTRLDALPADAETRIKALLAEIDTMRSNITAAQGRLKAAELEGIKLNPKEVDQLWKEDLRRCRMLGQVISTPVVAHPALPAFSGVETL